MKDRALRGFFMPRFYFAYKDVTTFSITFG
jgi:hypothetical protein